MKLNFYDTSSLLLIGDSLFSQENDNDIIISSITLKELENIKVSTNKDAQIKHSARQLLRKLNEHINDFICVPYRIDMEKYLNIFNLEMSNDTRILATAYYYYRVVLNEDSNFYFITNDLSLKMLASLYFDKNMIESVEQPEDDYKGYLDLTLTDEEMAEFYSNPIKYSQKINILTNQYLNIYDKNNTSVDTLCWTGEKFRPLKYKTFSSSQLGNIKPYKGDLYQAMAADSFHHNKITIIKGAAGTGKAQPNSTLIPTKNGYIQLGNIKVGDKILDRQGNETTVLKVFPQGLKENFKVTFSDGRIAYCNNQHIWSCYTSKNNLKDFTLQEIIDNRLQTKSGEWKYKIPKNSPIEYPKKVFDIDPYVMGVFLGDGCCKESSLTLSSQDEEIVKEVSKLIGAYEYSRRSDKNYNWDFYFQKKQKKQGIKTRFQTKEFFKNYLENLVQPAQNKSIPNIYKYGSIQQRYALIQGLMDTDGTIDNVKKGRTRFTSTSINLIKDLQEICWSLGMSASISCDNRKQKYKKNICYNLIISCSKENKPNLFRLKRKKDIATAYKNNNKKSTYSNTLTIKKIEKMPDLEEMTCILVDNAEHLYLTEQYIVTHNSHLALGYLFSLLDNNKIDKIIIFCNTVATKNSARLGFYPGSKNEKLLDSQIGNFLASKLGGIVGVEQLINAEKLILLPMSDIRGYDTSGMNAGIYITEAQNLDIELLKLALQRVGEDSVVILDGDTKSQVDLIDYEGSRNGMRRASEVFRGTNIYGEIELKNIHRSRIAEIANLM